MLDSQNAICGPRCDQCPAYIATKANDHDALSRMAEEWTEGLKRPFTPEDILCGGCRVQGGKLSAYCATCEIRNCAIQRNAETCAHCDEYPCSRTTAPQAKQALDEIRAFLGRK